MGFYIMKRLRGIRRQRPESVNEKNMFPYIADISGVAAVVVRSSGSVLLHRTSEALLSSELPV
jgi:hypothetical protein